MDNVSRDYGYRSAEPTWANEYLWPVIQRLLRDEVPPRSRIIDLGCGSGATAGLLAQLGHSVTGVDPSTSGIQLAKSAYPNVQFIEGSAYDNLATALGRFDAVVSLEVVEHCYWPRRYARTVFDLLKPGGLAVISTPFHGYWKNLALAISNKFDAHWSPLWDGGHVKFWSENTLGTLLVEAGAQSLRFERVGRIPPLAKSMVAIARKKLT